MVRGRGLSEVHQQFSDYASQIVRVRDGSPVVELGEAQFLILSLQCFEFACRCVKLFAGNFLQFAV